VRTLGLVLAAGVVAACLGAAGAVLLAGDVDRSTGETGVELPTVPDELDPSTFGPNDVEVARAFLEGWWRSRLATYVADGVFVRTLPDGTELRLRRTLVQRPPDVVLVQAGDVRAAVDGAIVRCTVDPEGVQRCTSGGTPADQRAAAEAELEAFAALFQGALPVYRLTAEDGACFALELRRALVQPPYGDRTRICFDPGTGAVVRLRIERDATVDEVVVQTVRSEVTDADLGIASAG